MIITCSHCLLSQRVLLNEENWVSQVTSITFDSTSRVRSLEIGKLHWTWFVIDSQLVCHWIISNLKFLILSHRGLFWDNRVLINDLMPPFMNLMWLDTENHFNSNTRDLWNDYGHLWKVISAQFTFSSQPAAKNLFWIFTQFKFFIALHKLFFLLQEKRFWFPLHDLSLKKKKKNKFANSLIHVIEFFALFSFSFVRTIKQLKFNLMHAEPLHFASTIDHNL